MIHCRLSVEKCSAFWAEGIAMVTIVASSTTISCAMLSRARTAHRFGSRCGESTTVSSYDRCAPWHASWRRCQAIASRNSLVRDPSVVLSNGWDRDERRALIDPVAAAFARRRYLLRGLGSPGLSERGELELVCRRARILVGQEEDCLGDPAWLRQRVGGDSATRGSGERLDAGVDDQQRHVNTNRAELKRSSVGNGSHAKCSRRPQAAAWHGAPRRPARDLHQRCRPTLLHGEPPAGRQERERGSGRSCSPGGKPAEG